MSLLYNVQSRITKMMRGLKHFFHDKRLGVLGLFSPQKRRLQTDLKAAFQYLKGCLQELKKNFY